MSPVDLANALSAHNTSLEEQGLDAFIRESLLVNLQNNLMKQYSIGGYADLPQEEYLDLDGVTADDMLRGMG